MRLTSPRLIERFRLALQVLTLLFTFAALAAVIPVRAQQSGQTGDFGVQFEALVQPDGPVGSRRETPMVIATVGPGGNYATLKLAFDAINAGTLTGAVQLDVIGDTTETATAVLNANGSGSASYTSVLIQPSGGAARTISGNLVDQALLALNGADNVTIDGLNSGGNALTLSNTGTSLFDETATLRFYGDASNNTVTNATLLGSGRSGVLYPGGTVWFSGEATTAGNNNNLISHCNIGPAGSNLPSHAILADGFGASGDGNVIDDNNIYDYFDAAQYSHGIYLIGSNRAWTISNNRFYQTAPRTQTAGYLHAAIEVGYYPAFDGGNDGHSIIDNVIGYASAAGTGTYSLVIPATNPASFYGILYNVAGAGATTTIQGNTITAISITTAQGAPFAGIRVFSSNIFHDFNISSNTIGSLTTPGAITYNSTTAGSADLYGIAFGPAQNVDMSYNSVGGITATNSAGGAIKLTALAAFTSASKTNVMTGNMVGSAAAPLSNNASATGSQTTGLACQEGRCLASQNAISHMTMNGANSGAGGTASLIGMLIDAPNSLLPAGVSANTIHSLSNSHPSAGVKVTGLYYRGAEAGTVARNFIYGLSTSSTGASASVNGVVIGGLATTGLPNSYTNNMIALGGGMTGNSPQIAGFNETFGGTGNYFHFNSVYIDGSSVAAGSGNSFAFFSSVANTTRSYRNNIFVNARSNGAATGKHYAIGAGGTTFNPTGLTSNNNVLLASGAGGVTGLFNAVDRATLADWQAATGQDADSFAADPQFLAASASTPDLHINPAVLTVVEGNGFETGLAIVDFDGATRSTLTPVDIGADAGNFIGADLLRPSIVYTPLAGTDSTANRAFGGVAITDSSGVNGAAGSKPRVYYKRATDGNVWNDNTSSTDGWKYVEANGASSPFDFTIDYARLSGGTGVSLGVTVQYFVVAQDLAVTPNVGINSGLFASAPASVGLTAAAFPVGGAINSYQVLQSFSGVYSVPGSYPSLTNTGGIFQALNAGTLTGNVVIEITADLTGETGQFSLGQLAESPAGSNFTMTIKPSGAPRTITTTASATRLIRLFGTDRFTIDGSLNGGTDRSLTLSNPNTGAGGPGVLSVISLGAGAGATDNTIKNCIIVGGSVGNSSVSTWGIYAGSSSAVQGPDNDNLTIQNNVIRQVKIGIQAYGGSAAPNDNLQIVGNILGDDVATDSIGSIAMDIAYAGNSTFSQNVVKNVSNSYGSPYGIRFVAGVVSSSVMRNNISGIRHTGSGGFGGVGLEITAGPSLAQLTVANNFISDIGGDGSSDALGNGIAGIRILGNPGGVSLYYNSVNLGSGSFAGHTNGTQSAALAIANLSLYLDIRNNIFATNLVNTNAPGAKTYAILTTATSGVIFTSINHNDYYSTSAQGVLGRLNSIDRTTLAGWQTASGQDASSIAANPIFISPTDLHIDPSALRLASPVANAGTPIAGITVDYDGGTRDAATPDIGGDEIGVALAVTLASFAAHGGADRVTVTWETVSELNNAGFNLYRNTTPDTPGILLAYVPSQGPGSAQGYVYSYDDADVEAGQTYWYWLEDIDLSGATTLHGPVSAVVSVPTAVTLASVSASPAAAGNALPWLLAVALVSLAVAAGANRLSGQR